jgi:hypothetical protein
MTETSFPSRGGSNFFGVSQVLSVLAGLSPVLAVLFPEAGIRWHLVLAVGTFSALGLSAARLTEFLLPGIEGLARTAAGFTISVAVGAVSTTWLGHFGLLSPRAVHLVIFAAYCLTRFLRPKVSARPAAAEGFGITRWDRTELAILIGAGAVFAGLLVCILVTSRLEAPGSRSFDDTSYHLSAMAAWRRFGDLRMIKFPVGDGGTAFYPVFGEIWSFLLLAPVDPSDFLARWSELPFALFSLVGLAAVGRALGLSGRSVFVAVLLYGATPRAFPGLMLTAGNDHMTSFLSIAAVLSVLLLGERRTIGRAVFAGICLGLLAGTKYTGLIYCLPLYILLSVSVLVTRGESGSAEEKWGHRLLILLVAVGVAVATGGYTYLRNFVTTGNPVFPQIIPLLGKTFQKGWEGGIPWSERPEYLIRPIAFLLGRADRYGELFRFTLLPAAIVAPLAALFIRARAGVRIRTVLTLGLPVVFYLEFLWLMIDHRDIRYFIGAIALAAVAAAWLVERAGRWAPVARSAVALAVTVSLIAGARTFDVSWSSLLVHAVSIAVAMLLGGLAWRRASTRRLFVGAAGLVFLGVLLLPVAQAVQTYQERKFSDQSVAAALEERTRLQGVAVACVGLNRPYAYWGARLQNTVFYVPSSPDPDAGFYRWGGSVAFPADDLSYETWRANLSRLGIRYVVLAHFGQEMPVQAWIELEPKRFLSVFRDELTEIFEVRESSGEGFPVVSIDPTFPRAKSYLGEGWYRDEVSGDRGEGVLVASAKGASIVAPPVDRSLAALRFSVVPRDPPVSMEVKLDGALVGEISTGGPGGSITLEVKDPSPPRRLRKIELVPRQEVALKGPFRIGTTGLSAPVPIVVESAGYWAFGAARFRIGGEEVTRKERGYNLIVLAPDGRGPAEAKSFDTSQRPNASREMAEFLQKLPDGAIVLGGVFDEASWSLAPEGIAALRRLGCRVDLRDKFRWSHAFIGVVGAEVGAIPEWADVKASAVAVGDESAVFRRIELVPTEAAAPWTPRTK